MPKSTDLSKYSAADLRKIQRQSRPEPFGVDGFVHRFASPGLPTSVANMGPTVDPKLRESIVATMNAQHNALKSEEFTYRETFEKLAK